MLFLNRFAFNPFVPAKTGTQGLLAPALRVVALGALSSQTKCNTFLERCCHGAQVRAVVIGRPMRDCPASRRRTNDPANRYSSGSLAIDHLSRDKAQPWPRCLLQPELCSGADEGAALGGVS